MWVSVICAISMQLSSCLVAPAKAGAQPARLPDPAFAGMTNTYLLQHQQAARVDGQADGLAMAEIAARGGFHHQRLRLADIDEQPRAVAEEEGRRHLAAQRGLLRRLGKPDVFRTEQDLGGMGRQI